MIFCVSYISGKSGPVSWNPQITWLLQKLFFMMYGYSLDFGAWGYLLNILVVSYIVFP